MPRATTRVAVLRGGASDEYEVSMRTGTAVLRSLDRLGYTVKDVVITKQGEWLDGGRVRRPEQVLTGVDVVFLALHGAYGEDGTIQRFLTTHCIPYTGSQALPSAIAFHKGLTHKQASEAGVKTAKHHIHTAGAEVTTEHLAALLDDSVDRLVLKPLQSGSSIDVHIGVTADEVPSLLTQLEQKYEQVMVEQYLTGREVTVGVVDRLREQTHYVLPAVEITPPPEHNFYSYDAKYTGVTTFDCPARVSRTERDALLKMAQTVHQALGLRHYSRSDFIIKDGLPYFLEVNTLPGLTEHSLFPQALGAVGVTYDEFVNHLIELAAP